MIAPNHVCPKCSELNRIVVTQWRVVGAEAQLKLVFSPEPKVTDALWDHNQGVSTRPKLKCTGCDWRGALEEVIQATYKHFGHKTSKKDK